MGHKNETLLLEPLMSAEINIVAGVRVCLASLEGSFRRVEGICVCCPCAGRLTALGPTNSWALFNSLSTFKPSKNTHAFSYSLPFSVMIQSRRLI